MAKLELHRIWERLTRSKAAGQVAGELAGPQARLELLAQTGYAGQPQGLLERLAGELLQALPLATSPAQVRSFGGHFPGPSLMEAAQEEAQLEPPRTQGDELVPASQVKAGAEEEAALQPWGSGQRFLRLCRSWLLSGDDELAQAAGQQMAGFCQAYPPLMGLAWQDPARLSTRALNWLWGLRFLAVHPSGMAALGPEAGLGCLLHLRIMGAVLLQELSVAPLAPSVPLAGALMFLGRGLALLPEAPAWWQAGCNALGPGLMAWREPAPAPGWRQVSAAAEWGGLGIWLGSKSQAELPGAVAGLRHLAGLCRAASLPWGGMALWGGEDGGPVLGFDPRPEQAWTGAANLASLLLDDPELRGPRLLDERAYWVFGPEATQKLRLLAGGGAPGVRDWPGAGLTSLCGLAAKKRVGVFLRSGPRQAGQGDAAGGQAGQASPTRRNSTPDLNMQAAPGEASALALALCLEGQPVLVTPGPRAGGPLAPALASRSAHSVVMLDGQEPRGGQVVVESLEAGERHLFVAATYDGYAWLADPVFLRRRVFLDLEAGLLNLVDQVQGQGQHLVEVFFHLPPQSKVKAAGQGSYLLEGPFGRVLFKPEPKCRVSLVQGRAEPPLGWLALEAGKIVPAPVLRLQAVVVGSARLACSLVLETKGQALAGCQSPR